MRTIIIVLFLTLFLILSLPFLGIEWIIRKFNPKHADLIQLRLAQWAFKIIIFLSGMNLKVIGEENVPTDEPVLYVGNHRGFFDIVVTYARCPGITGYISKDSIKKVPLLGMWMKRLHCLFLDRKDIKQGLKTILSAIDEAKNGVSFCIFPEGTRNKDNNPTNVLPFKEGSFKIATKSQCKIVPMAVIGTENVLENNFPWIKKTNVTLIYGEPVDSTTLPKETLKHIGAHCHDIVTQLIIDEITK